MALLQEVLNRIHSRLREAHINYTSAQQIFTFAVEGQGNPKAITVEDVCTRLPGLTPEELDEYRQWRKDWGDAN